MKDYNIDFLLPVSRPDDFRKEMQDCIGRKFPEEIAEQTHMRLHTGTLDSIDWSKMAADKEAYIGEYGEEARNMPVVTGAMLTLPDEATDAQLNEFLYGDFGVHSEAMEHINTSFYEGDLIECGPEGLSLTDDDLKALDGPDTGLEQ